MGDEEATPIDILFFVIFIILAIVGTIGNLCIIATGIIDERLRKFTHILILNQAASDLSLAAISLPLRILSIGARKSFFHSKVVSSDMFCKVTAAVNVMHIGSMSFGLLLLTSSKFLAVCFPIWHRAKMRVRYLIIGIALSWILPMIIGFCGMFMKGVTQDAGKHEHDVTCMNGSIFKDGYSVFIYVSTLILPLIIILPMYIFVLAKVRRSWKFVVSSNTENKVLSRLPGLKTRRSVADLSAFRKKEIKLTKGIFTILGVHITCLTPIVILDFLHIIMHSAVSDIAVHISLVILYLNAVLDPPIYTRHCPEIKRTLLRLLRCKKRAAINRSLATRTNKTRAQTVTVCHKEMGKINEECCSNTCENITEIKLPDKEEEQGRNECAVVTESDQTRGAV
eukprot:Seg1329.13 transcript_id=Seg1329.13/GoldUCD/mRNA.D3Y31 product="alpha-1A adrenergic receptor" protein_id=Seg1329.13/GoldUCD/D3Y31